MLLYNFFEWMAEKLKMKRHSSNKQQSSQQCPLKKIVNDVRFLVIYFSLFIPHINFFRGFVKRL